MKLADKRPAGMSLNSFCKYMCITRSNFYYEHRSESSENLKIMQIIDDYFLDHPTTGVVRMTQKLRLSGYRVNEKRDINENLNAPGAHFVPLAFAQQHTIPDRNAEPGTAAPNRFYMYGVVARLALLAASIELERTDPEMQG